MIIRLIAMIPRAENDSNPIIILDDVIAREMVMSNGGKRFVVLLQSILNDNQIPLNS